MGWLIRPRFFKKGLGFFVSDSASRIVSDKDKLAAFGASKQSVWTLWEVID